MVREDNGFMALGLGWQEDGMVYCDDSGRGSAQAEVRAMKDNKNVKEGMYTKDQ